MSVEKGVRYRILRIGSSYLITNVDDALKLRKHRICGAMSGTKPKQMHRSDQLVLPMILLPEQVMLLISQGLADVVQYKDDQILRPIDEYKKDYDRWLKMEIEKQSQEYHEKSIEKSLKHARDIAIGRKAKALSRNQTLDDDSEEPKAKQAKLDHNELEGDSRREVTDEEVAKVEEELRARPRKLLTDTEVVREIWLESPFHDNDQYEPVMEIAPQSESEKLRYAVMVDLWGKGYFLTSGIKFGGDYLAYPADPYLCHASHIIVCLSDPNPTSTDKAAWCRLGSQVKKIVLLCTWDQTDRSKISYTSLQWKRI